MKKSQKYSMLFIIWLFLLSSVSFAFAATPNYVGIDNNDSYTWNTTYDEGPLKDYYEDYGEKYGWSELQIDTAKDEISMDEDLTQIKIVILDVDDEEKTPWREDGVRIIYNFYMKEEGEDWDLEEEDETWAVWKYDHDFYDGGVWESPVSLGFDWKFEYDPIKVEWEDWKYLEANNPWFLSTKTDWGEVEDELEGYYEDDRNYEEVKTTREDDTLGIEITIDKDEDDDVEAWTYIVEYDDNGVLLYYEWQYDKDPIVIVEREGKFFYDNFLWIVLGIIGVIAVIVIIIVVVKRR